MRNPRRYAVPTLLSCVIVAAACAVLAAAAWLRSDPAKLPTLDLRGADAAARGWPAHTPFDNPPWPDVTQWTEASRFGYVRQQAWSSADRKTTHQMVVDRYGWPFTVFEKRQLWRPWEDPKWASTEPNDTGLYTRWDGVVLNSFAIGLPAFLLMCGPGFLRRRERRRHGQCIECGYDLRGTPATGPGARCPECGMPIESQTPVAEAKPQLHAGAGDSAR